MKDEILFRELSPLLTTKYIGRNVIYFDSTTSTNDVAKNEGAKGAKGGTIVIADEQTKGRGRMERQWVSNKGEDILVSIILRPNINSSLAPSITPILSISVVEALLELTGYPVLIKWPNDVVIGYKKLCGILTEMSAGIDCVNYIVMGMGMNVNSINFPDEIKNTAVSLREYGGKIFDRKVILASILNKFEHNYEKFKLLGISPFIESLRSYSILIGKNVVVNNMGKEIEGCAVSIDDEGKLIIRKKDGETEKILSGEVSLKGFYGTPPV